MQDDLILFSFVFTSAGYELCCRTDRKIYIPYRYYLMNSKKKAQDQNVNSKLKLVIQSGKYKIGKYFYQVTNSAQVTETPSDP